jgi:hypothetical protein
LQGAPAAALLFAGEAHQVRLIKHLNPGNDAVGFAANLPSVYQLLPPPPDLLTGSQPYPLNWDPYDVSAWGLEQVRPDLLYAARRFHQIVRRGQPDIEQIEIAGCHCHTVTGLRRELTDGYAQPLVAEYHDIGPDSGDEQVPLWSAHAPEVTTYYAELSHNALVQSGPTLDAVIALVHGDPVTLPTGAVPPSVGRRSALESLPLLQQMTELRRRLAAGSITREDIQQIFFAG